MPKTKKKQQTKQTTKSSAQVDERELLDRDLLQRSKAIKELDAETMEEAMQEGELPYNETFIEKTTDVEMIKELIKNRNLFDEPVKDIIADKERMAEAYQEIERGRMIAALHKHSDELDQPIDEIVRDEEALDEALDAIDYDENTGGISAVRTGQDHAVYTPELDDEGDISRIVELGKGLSSHFVNVPPSRIATLVDAVIEESEMAEQAGEGELERLVSFDEKAAKGYPSSFAVQVGFDEIDIEGRDMTIKPTLNFINAYDKTSSFTVNPSFTITQSEAEQQTSTTYEAPTDFLLQFADEDQREAIREALEDIGAQMSEDSLSMSHRGSKQENAEERQEEAEKMTAEARQYFEAMDTIVGTVSQLAERLPDIQVGQNDYRRIRNAMIKDNIKPKTQYERAVELGKYMDTVGQMEGRKISDPDKVKSALGLRDKDFEDDEYREEFEQMVEDNENNQFLIMEGDGYELLAALGEYMFDQTADSSNQLKKILKGNFMGGRRGRAAHHLQ